MADQLAVVNQALFHLGNEPVPDLGFDSQDASNALVKLLRVMETSRQTVLRRHGWECALEYIAAAPAVIANYANFRYGLVYQMPGDYLRAWEIEGVTFSGSNACWEPRWQIGTFETDLGALNIIRAGNGGAYAPPDPTVTTSNLNVVYVRDASWQALDQNLADAIALDAAARSAYSVNGDQARAKELAQMAEAKVLLAISIDATQEGGQPALAGSIAAAIRRMAGESGGYMTTSGIVPWI